MQFKSLLQYFCADVLLFFSFYYLFPFESIILSVFATAFKLRQNSDFSHIGLEIASIYLVKCCRGEGKQISVVFRINLKKKTFVCLFFCFFHSVPFKIAKLRDPTSKIDNSQNSHTVIYCVNCERNEMEIFFQRNNVCPVTVKSLFRYK